MGLTVSKKDRIYRYIMESILNKKAGIAKDAASNFDISLTTAYRYIRELESGGLIKKNGEEVSKYELLSTTKAYNYYEVSQLEEDAIFNKDLKIHFVNLPNNIQRIWEYSITEMLNNAIDHSRANCLKCVVSQDYLYTRVYILDDGIGALENIRSYFSLNSVDDAIAELFKGKLTTDPERHSGEGIFFTSKVMDTFILWSGSKVFTRSNFADLILDERDVECMINIKETLMWQGIKPGRTAANTSHGVALKRLKAEVRIRITQEIRWAVMAKAYATRMRSISCVWYAIH